MVLEFEKNRVLTVDDNAIPSLALRAVKRLISLVYQGTAVTRIMVKISHANACRYFQG